MPIPIVSIVGKSDAGKTTLIEKLIAELTRRGYRVATVKHARHGFDIDWEGKDSWRHKKAGARITVVASPSQVAVLEDTDRDYALEDIRERYIRDADIILAEGYKGNPFPKIEVYREELNRELLCGDHDNLLAVASDVTLDLDVPSLNLNDVKGIADWIERKIPLGSLT